MKHNLTMKRVDFELLSDALQISIMRIGLSVNNNHMDAFDRKFLTKKMEWMEDLKTKIDNFYTSHYGQREHGEIDSVRLQ